MGFGPFLLKLFLLRSYFVFSFLAFYLAGVSFLFSINLFATEENNEKKIIKKITNTPVIKKNSQKKPPEKISEKKPPEKKPEDPIDFADFLKGEESYEGSLRFQGELSEQVRKVFRFEGYRVVAIRSVSLKTYFVQLIGKFLIPGWGLVWEKGEATKNLDEVVMLNLPVMALKNKFQLILVGPKGKVEKINIILEFPNLAQKKQTPWSFNFGVGGSLISYTETPSTKISLPVITVKGGLSYKIVPNTWDAGVSAYGTAYPLQAVEPASMRFIGVNVRLGYQFKWPSFPWIVMLHSGVYYTTMIVPDYVYGFTNMVGPQIFPTVARVFANANSLGGYFKFSPVGSGGFAFQPGSREMAYGGSYNFALSSGKKIGIGMDVANIRLQVEDVIIQSNSYSLGVTFSF